MNQTYLDTAKALVAAAPHVFFDDTFALKGGTAINLFFRDMPRLSVDLDLVLPDHTLPWAAARKRIDSTLAESRKRLQAAGFQVAAAAGNNGQETRLQLTRGNVLVKVEVNFVMRDCFDAVTPNAAKVMHLQSYGLEAGCDASFVLLQARDAVEAIRLRANRLKVWRKGVLVAEMPEVVARLLLPQRSSATRFMPSR